MNIREWKVYLTSWNVNAQPSPEVCDFFAPHLFPADALDCDLIFIGLQEVPVLVSKEYISDVFGAEQWSLLFRKFLCPPKRSFIQLSGSPSSRPRLFGLETLIFVKKDLLSSICKVETQFCRLGYVGEKGAVGVRLTSADGTHITVINCHLTPHQENLPRRIKDYAQIISSIRFGLGAQKIISDDYVFFLGDLNFRVDYYSAQEAIRIADGKSHEASMERLINNDQLLRCKRAEEAFSGFTESELLFPPTYKFLLNSSAHNAERIPSWCDRILYRVHDVVGSNPGRPANFLKCEMQRYDSVMAVKLSDHKPVVALCTLTLSTTSISNGFLAEFGITPGEAWLLAQENRCQYRFINDNYTPAMFDWVGVFKEGFQSDSEDLITWMYHMSSWREAHEKSGEQYENLLFKRQYLKETGRHRLGYFSRAKNCLIGLSEPFEIINAKLDVAETAEDALQ